MKKIFIFFLSLFLCSNIANPVFAVSNNTISNLVDLFEKPLEKKETRIENLEKLHKLISMAYNKVANDKIHILNSLENEIKNRLNNHGVMVASIHIAANTNETNKGTLKTSPYPGTMEKWLELHNSVRNETIQLNDKLNNTAQIRAEYLAKNNVGAGSTHKRNIGDRYYDFEKIKDRFSGYGVEFELIDGWMFSESVGFGSANCNNKSDGECDELLKSATMSTRNFFYHRERPINGPHYRAIIQNNFKEIGIGIAINKETRRYYVVLHYGTSVSE